VNFNNLATLGVKTHQPITFKHNLAKHLLMGYRILSPFSRGIPRYNLKTRVERSTPNLVWI